MATEFRPGDRVIVNSGEVLREWRDRVGTVVAVSGRETRVLLDETLSKDEALVWMRHEHLRPAVTPKASDTARAVAIVDALRRNLTWHDDVETIAELIATAIREGEDNAKCTACRHRLALWCGHCVDNGAPTPEPTR